jgi:hypothetical protein
MRLQDNKGAFRLSCVGLAIIMPVYWLCVAAAEFWKREPITEVYKDIWKAFKKGKAA